MSTKNTLVAIAFKRTFTSGPLVGLSVNDKLVRIPLTDARRMVNKCRRDGKLVQPGILGTSDSELYGMRIVQNKY